MPDNTEKDLGTLIDQSYENADLGKFKKGDIPVVRLKNSIETLVEDVFADASIQLQRRVGTQILSALMLSGNPGKPLTKEKFRAIVSQELDRSGNKDTNLDRLTGT